MAWWGQQLVSHEGMLGFLLTPLEGVILVINSYVIAISLEVIFHHPGAPLCEINILGWERIVTVFDLYGLLISLAQSIGASVCYQAAEHKRSMVWICAMAALTSLVAFEVGTACYRGLLLGDSVNACLSSLFAFGIAMIHVVVGIRVIDNFLVPLLLTLLWLPLAPFCLVFDRILRALAVPLAALDTGVMKPLPLLDHLAFRTLSRITLRMQPSHLEGGNTYATERIAWESSQMASDPGNGSQPPLPRRTAHAATADGWIEPGAGMNLKPAQRRQMLCECWSSFRCLAFSYMWSRSPPVSTGRCDRQPMLPSRGALMKR